MVNVLRQNLFQKNWWHYEGGSSVAYAGEWSYFPGRGDVELVLVYAGELCYLPGRGGGYCGTCRSVVDVAVVDRCCVSQGIRFAR